MDIEELSQKIDKYHEENKDMEWMKLGLIAGGFALATISLATTDRNWPTIVIAVIFTILGIIFYLWGAYFRERKRQKK